MIATLLCLYAAGTLTLSDTPATSPHTMPWNDQTTLEATPVPQKDPSAIAPVIKAKAAIAVDLKNGLILYEKNIHEPLPIASLTKLMTAVIVLEENNLKEVVKVSKGVSQTEGSKIWLAPDEKIIVENLMYGILINSANDAAMALAEFNSGTVEKFVEKMNTKTHELGLIATNFVNPTGLNEPPKEKVLQPDSGNTQPPANQPQENKGMGGNKSILDLKSNEAQNQYQNFSTAYDLTLLARYAYGKSFVRRATIKKEMEVASVNEKITHKLKNTNEMLESYLNVLGLKTGTTDEAGECLIAIIENDEGHDILTVVLNSPSRYNETKILADWVFRAYKWN